MDLDFKSVKALASPTRLEILNHVLEEEATTTGLSRQLDKSKSTVSSHLKVLTESGLLEKEDVEGRRRVVYRPTDKARAIVKGRERKVKFSVVSTAFSSILGAVILGGSMISSTADSPQFQDRGSEMMLEAEDAAASTAAEASQFSALDITVLVVGFGLLITAALMLLYSYALKKLG